MSDEFDEQAITERTSEHLKTLRKKVSVNAGGTDFICETEPDGTDAARLSEFQAVMVKMILAEANSFGADRRLLEKMSGVMELVARGVRIVDGDKVLQIGSWRNLNMPDWTFLDKNQLAEIQRARELVADGKPLEVETLFTSLETQTAASAAVRALVGNGIDAAIAHDPVQMEELCGKLGIETEPGQHRGYPQLKNPMEKAIYSHYANTILLNSTFDGRRGGAENKYLAAGLMREINDIGRPSVRNNKQ